MFGSVNTGRPVSQQRLGATEMVEHGDGLRAFGRTVTGSESGLDGWDGLII